MACKLSAKLKSGARARLKSDRFPERENPKWYFFVSNAARFFLPCCACSVPDHSNRLAKGQPRSFRGRGRGRVVVHHRSMHKVIYKRTFLALFLLGLAIPYAWHQLRETALSPAAEKNPDHEHRAHEEDRREEHINVCCLLSVDLVLKSSPPWRDWFLHGLQLDLHLGQMLAACPIVLAYAERWSPAPRRNSPITMDKDKL